MAPDASEISAGWGREVPEEDAGRSPSVDSSSDARAARLWANVLQYALALGRWGDAYAAVLSTPGDEACASALRRLTAAACGCEPSREWLRTTREARERLQLCRQQAGPCDVAPIPTTQWHV